jgi:hypothetical protein
MKTQKGMTSEELRNHAPGNWQKDIKQKLPTEEFRFRLFAGILSAVVFGYIGYIVAIFVWFILPTLCK